MEPNDHPVHERFMRRALTAARKGWGTTHPNPMVGAVIVEQAANGVSIRMAVLYLLLGGSGPAQTPRTGAEAPQAGAQAPRRAAESAGLGSVEVSP